MKALYLSISLVFCGGILHAQVGIGTTAPNSNAVLELVSPGNNQGFLVPRLTTAQRTALTLSAAENGMLVFDSNENKFYYWQASQWLPLRAGNDVVLSAGAGVEITGNTISVIPDGDGDATNEIQDLQLNGSTLSITNNPSSISVDLAPFLGANTDEQTLNYDATTGALDITNGNSVTLTPAGAAGGALSGNYPNPTIAGTAGSNIVTAINNGSATAINTNRLATAVVLESESPAASDIAGTFATGLSINSNAVTTAKINDLAVTTAKIANSAITDTKIANGAVTTGKIAPSATLGQVLTTGATGVVWADLPTAGIGVTSITAGTGLTGGTITGVGTIGLSNTGVTATTYGSSTTVPRITVDAQGRITSASSVSITAGATEGLGETLAASPDAGGGMAYNLKSVSIGDWAKGPGLGALNVNGSHFVNYAFVDDGYTVTDNDYILIGNVGSLKPVNIELPDPGKYQGRILIIRSQAQNQSEAVIARCALGQGIEGQTSSEPLFVDANFSNNTAYTITLLSTGNMWVTISRSIGKSKG